MRFPTTLTDDERSVVDYLGSHESRELLTHDFVCARECDLRIEAAQVALLGLVTKDAIEWTPDEGSTPGHWRLTSDGRTLVL